MAGGTGGHIFPALPVAEILRRNGHEIFWMGTRNGLETKLLPAAAL
jgi:UDP-N-acetylglucosamine--N-acetylmuramyl-(pentapeptide) pyrophosphoryl-undecaprenol N-acetylglucosamine transferase